MKQWRLVAIFSLGVAVAAIIIGRLFYLQVLEGKFYQSQALGQQTGFAEVQGARGEIFFDNSKETLGAEGSGEIKSLAINTDAWIVSAVPQNIKDKNAFADAVSKPLGYTKEDLLNKLKESDTYVILKKGVDAATTDALRKLNIDGLSFENSPERYYPQESLAAQVIGFVGGQNTGQYGVEAYYNDILAGKKGIKQNLKGLDLIGANQTEQNLDGSDLYLTIDYNIQYQAEALLKQAHKDIDIDSGQIIVIKPDSGRILAMANYPSFNPNDYGKETSFEVFQNSTVQKLFEPGSVFKPFTMAMGLQEGKITPESTFTDTGSVTIGPNTLYNFDREKYGFSDMSRILEKSINTGAVFVEQKIPHATFFDYVNKFGFNDKTGIDVQGEVSSNNDRLKKGADFDYATASFGQGIELTPIQLVKAFCVFADGGKMPSPYIVEKTVNGSDEQDVKPQTSDPVISEQTASEVTKMMINVVEKGFGSSARVPGYYLAGKTGTAEVPMENQKGYYSDRTIQSFIGFGPALNPKFLILVKFDNPKVPKSSLSAAPVFKKMAQYIINYWQIPPDYSVSTK